MSQDISTTYSEKAIKLHKSSIVFDTHVDTLLRVLDRHIDLGLRNNITFLDIPRLREGGVKVQVFAVWIAPDKYPNEKAVQRALDLMDALHDQIRKNPNDLGFANNIPEAKKIIEKGKIACMLGIEGGSAINHNLDNIKMFYDKGIKYMTLTWTKSNDIGDSSEDTEKWGGLSPFGIKAVKEMNRVGMIVDISHVSDKCASQVLDISTKPVIFSHSGCKAVANHPRNVPDELLRKLAKNNGVIGMNFFNKFVSIDSTKPVTVEDVLNHIDHAVKVAGIDHVGLGSDYDGAHSYPVGLEDCSKYPAITEGLLKRGYKDEDIKKILGENFLRVFNSQ